MGVAGRVDAVALLEPLHLEAARADAARAGGRPKLRAPPPSSGSGWCRPTRAGPDRRRCSGDVPSGLPSKRRDGARRRRPSPARSRREHGAGARRAARSLSGAPAARAATRRGRGREQRHQHGEHHQALRRVAAAAPRSSDLTVGSALATERGHRAAPATVSTIAAQLRAPARGERDQHQQPDAPAPPGRRARRSGRRPARAPRRPPRPPRAARRALGSPAMRTASTEPDARRAMPSAFQ